MLPTINGDPVMAKKLQTAGRTKWTAGDRPTESFALDIRPLVERLFDVLSALKDTESKSQLFRHGVESIHLKVNIGDNSVELSIGGSAAGIQRIEHRAADVLSVERALAVLALTGFELLPQVSGNGYYSYSPDRNQFGTKNTISAVLDVGRQWQMNGQPPFGVGDISLQQGGPMPGHTTGHQIGRNVDLRPMRTDGEQKPVTWQDPAYSRELTQLLVDNFLGHANSTKIFFNDSKIKGVQPLKEHDNHLHIEMAS